jgi:hypothetical protein
MQLLPFCTSTPTMELSIREAMIGKGKSCTSVPNQWLSSLHDGLLTAWKSLKNKSFRIATPSLQNRNNC